MEKLVPKPFLKNQSWRNLWNNSLKFYSFGFYCMPSWGLSRHNETKLQTTCFYLILSFFKKQKEVWIFFLLYYVSPVILISWERWELLRWNEIQELVKVVVVTNMFFSNQKHEIKTKQFIYVKQIKSPFFSNNENQNFYS